MKSAYTSKFYLKQPKYASSVLLPQMMSSRGAQRVGGRRWVPAEGPSSQPLPGHSPSLAEGRAQVTQAEGSPRCQIVLTCLWGENTRFTAR